MSLSSLSDKTIVLALANSTCDALRKNLMENGIVDPMFYRVRGNAKKRNNGGVTKDTTLMEILAHNKADETSLDIYHNHIGMIRHAYQAGYERALFMEEDARFENDMDASQVARVIAWIRENQEWDIFYLGYCPWPVVVSFPISTNIVDIPSPYLGHCYLLSRRGMKKILDYHPIRQKKICHIDKVLANIPGLVKRGTYPALCFQEKEPALYREAQKKLYLPLSFRRLCKIMETVALLWPILFVLLLVYYVTKRLLIHHRRW